MKNILIVGAHYDDTDLGVGGTAAFLSSKGKKVYKLTLTNNATNFKEKKIFVDSKSSIESSARACSILGISEITDFIPEPCNELVYSTSLMQRIEKIIFEKKIDTIFFHYDHDMNRDHVVTSQLCVVAGRHCKNLFMYQSNGYIPDNQFHPTVFFDISDFIELKREALSQYGKEHDRFNRLFEMNIQRNSVWGYGCETPFVEGFIPIKMVVNDEW